MAAHNSGPPPRIPVHNICMRIGQLAASAEVNVQTLRFYEREGLLRIPQRTPSGYRSYDQSDLDRVRFIRLCQGLGFTLREVHQLLHLHARIAECAGKKSWNRMPLAKFLGWQASESPSSTQR